MPEARTIEVLLAQYGESHRHPANEIIHLICVPAIMFSVLGLLWALHALAALAAGLIALRYYLRLSAPLAAGMLLAGAAMLGLLALLPPPGVAPLSLAVFVLAWIGQFIGHRIEGKKPAFFDDVRFLLIGPLFVLGYLYRRLGLAY